MDNDQKTIWNQSVTGVVIRDNKVLLARHTYGGGKGMLIVPGGYMNMNETPQDALKREYLEETNVCIEPERVIGIRFNLKDWYVAFSARYISGEPKSDHNENSEVIWLDINEALVRDDVPDLTKKLISCAMNPDKGFEQIPYTGSTKNGPNSLYGA